MTWGICCSYTLVHFLGSRMLAIIICLIGLYTTETEKTRPAKLRHTFLIATREKVKKVSYRLMDIVV